MRTAKATFTQVITQQRCLRDRRQAVNQQYLQSRWRASNHRRNCCFARTVMAQRVYTIMTLLEAVAMPSCLSEGRLCSHFGASSSTAMSPTAPPVLGQRSLDDGVSTGRRRESSVCECEPSVTKKQAPGSDHRARWLAHRLVLPDARYWPTAHQSRLRRGAHAGSRPGCRCYEEYISVYLRPNQFHFRSAPRRL